MSHHLTGGFRPGSFAALIWLLASMAAPAQAGSSSRQNGADEAGSAAAGTSSATQASATSADPGEIVVTALRRDTRVQNTPLAITARTGQQLASAGITDFSQLTRIAPSLTIVDQGAGKRRVLIRGIQAAGESTTGVYFDETPMSGATSTANDAAGRTTDLRLFDIDRVEVLRGPQGTLFGSGSMGGTLRVIFNKPTQQFEGAYDVQATDIQHGSFGTDDNVMLNVPLTSTLAVRGIGYYSRSEGYVDNVRYGRTDDNKSRNYGGRFLARFKPADNLTIDGSINIQNIRADLPRWYQDLGAYNTDAQSPSYNIDRLRVYNLTGHWTIGGVSITGSSSYIHRFYMESGDVSPIFQGYLNAAGCQTFINPGAPCSPTQLSGFLSTYGQLANSSLYIPQTIKTYINELRASSTGNGPFQWTVGAYQEHRKSHILSQLRVSDPADGLFYATPDIQYQRTVGDILSQKALYAEASYRIFPKFTLTGGIRYFDYKRVVSGSTDIPQLLLGAPTTVPIRYNRSSEDGKIFKVNASYQANRDLLLYFQASQGFRPGGVNQFIAGLPAELQAFHSDSLWNYEVGVKSKPLHWLTVDGALYRIDWDNIQISGTFVGQAFSFITNAGAARIQGAELEVTAEPLHGLLLQGAFGYNDARLTEDQSSSVVAGPGRAGDRLAYIPKVTASGSAEYRMPLNDATNLMLHGDIARQGSSYSEINASNPYYRKVDAYTVVNARIGVETNKEKIGVYLFVNNVFDVVAINSLTVGTNTGNRTTLYSLPPRTFGLEMRSRF